MVPDRSNGGEKEYNASTDNVAGQGNNSIEGKR